MRRLICIGLFRAIVRPKGKVGFIFVHKSKGSETRRMLFCRPSRQMFQPPPGTPLATIESMCSIELSEDVAKGVHLFVVGVSDIYTFFHRLRVPRGLSELFCLDIAFTAKELGLSG